MQKTALSIAASIALLALFASPASAAPTADFTVESGTLRTGVPVTFTSTSTAPTGATITKQEWDFNNDGTVDATGDEVDVMFQNPGTRQVKLTVTSSELLDNQGTTTKPVTIVTRPPSGDFSFNPGAPFVGDDVLFAPDASDPDGDNLTYSWDFGDGSAESKEHTPIHTFTNAGTHTVTLTISDGHTGGTKTVAHDVEVRGVLVPGNRLPTARFAFSPRIADVGDPVEFVSGSSDPDGELREQVWDLDGDGAFDDARGDDVFFTFTSPGEKTVRLQVTDSAGASTIYQRQITVRRPPKPPPGHLVPDPDIRFNGLLFDNGTRVRVLGVKAPRGTLVTVRCKGKGCGAKQRRKRIKGRAVRFRSYQRFLHAGVRLEIFIAKSGQIGEYRRYKIRGGKSPKRVDRCLNGLKLRPVKC